MTIDDVAGRAGVGKGTVYLHWKTREALFWAVLQREALRLFDRLLEALADEPETAMPHRLIRTILLELTHRPLVKALPLADPVLLGSLAADESVRAAQQELAENTDLLRLLAEHDALQPGLTPESAGYLLDNVTRGFLTPEELGQDEGLPLERRADLLEHALRRSIEADTPPSGRVLAELNRQVVTMFSEMRDAHREQLQRSS